MKEMFKTVIGMWLDIIFDYLTLSLILIIPFLLFIFISEYDPQKVLLYVFYAMTLLVLSKKIVAYFKN